MKKNKVFFYTIIFCLVIIVIGIIGFYIYNSIPSIKLRKQLDLGQKYLEEQNYDEAIIAFESAIKIEPMSVDAYLGLVDAYVALDDIESAIAVLERGCELTKSEELNRVLSELKQKMITGDFEVLGISVEYDYYGYANKGIIIVGKDEQYGAVDYDNNVIVPLEYSDCCNVANDDGQTWFFKDDIYYVFDAEGNVIFNTSEPISAVSEGVVLCSGVVNGDYVIKYVKFDNTILFETIIQDYDEYYDIASAVGFNDGKAYVCTEDYPEGNRIFTEITDIGNVTDVSDRYYKVNRTENESGGPIRATVSVDNAGWPIGAVNDGHFVSGIYDEMFVTSTSEDRWEEVGLGEYFYKNLSENNFDSWALDGYFKDGVLVFNKETLCNVILHKGEEKIYILSDAWNENNRKLGEYDYLKLSDEDLWLICKDEQWGYIDHSGNIVALFDDASDFSDGKAIVIEDGNAYMIDKNMNKLNKGCKADEVYCYGDIWAMNIDDMYYFIR